MVSLPSVLLTIQCYMVITVVDLFLAWVQPATDRWPRRLTHGLTEPIQRPIRHLIDVRWTGGWDLSALVVITFLGVVRFWLIQP